MNDNTTDWFPGDIKPVRKGIYQRKGADCIRYGYWNGRHWCFTLRTLGDAAQFTSSASSYQSLPWRGLLKGSA